MFNRYTKYGECRAHDIHDFDIMLNLKFYIDLSTFVDFIHIQTHIMKVLSMYFLL